MKIFGRADSVVDTISIIDNHSALACSGMIDSISTMMSSSSNFIQLWTKMESSFSKIMGSLLSKLHFMIIDEEFITSLKHAEGSFDEKFRFREIIIGDVKTILVEIKRNKEKEIRISVSKKTKKTKCPSKFKI